MRTHSHTLLPNRNRPLRGERFNSTMGESASIECIAIVGKQNDPLYVRNFTSKPDLELHYFVNNCLDAIEEQMKSPSRGNDPYLGLVFFMENFNIYAYCTSTRVKFILVIRWNERHPKDAAVKTLMTTIHKAYMQLVSNPFYAVDGEIRGRQCQKFIETIDSCTL